MADFFGLAGVLRRGSVPTVMKQAIKLGKPTEKGVRQSIGYYLKDGRLVQKVFWFGHDRTMALQKLVKLREIAAAVPSDSAGKLVWDDARLLHVDAAFQVIDPPSNAQTPIPTPRRCAIAT